MISFKIEGMKEVEEALRELTNDRQFISSCKKSLFTAAKKMAGFIDTRYRAVAMREGEDTYSEKNPMGVVKPVKTGKKTGKWGARFWTGVVAKFPLQWLEFGRNGQPARPFMRPVFEAHVDFVVQQLQLSLESFVKYYKRKKGL